MAYLRLLIALALLGCGSATSARDGMARASGDEAAIAAPTPRRAPAPEPRADVVNAEVAHVETPPPAAHDVTVRDRCAMMRSSPRWCRETRDAAARVRRAEPAQ